MADDYAVVIFESDEDDEETVEIVSASWIESKNDEKYCYWPHQNHFNKARKHQRPDTERWKRYKIRRVWLVDDFEKAKALRDTAMDTSNPEDEGGAVENPLTKRQRQLPSRFMDDSDADGESDSDSQPQPLKVPRRSPRKINKQTIKTSTKTTTTSAGKKMPVAPKFGTLPTVKSSVSRSLGHASTATSPSNKSGSMSPPGRKNTERHASTATSSSNKPGSISPPGSMSPPGRKNTENSFLVNILMKLNRLEENQADIKQLLQRILSSGTGGASNEIEIELLESPIDSVEELEEIDARLADDREFKNKMMKYLALVGGEDIGETVRRMLRKVGTNKLWSSYNMEGRMKKRSFRKMQFFTVMKNTALKNYSGCTEKSVERALAEYLKSTPFKSGGRNCKDPDKEHEVEEVEEVQEMDEEDREEEDENGEEN